MSDECKFSVGQEVTVEGSNWGGDVFLLRTVKSVSKRPMCVTLSDDSKWEWSGYRPWRPRADRDVWYTGPHLRERRPDDKERAARLKAIRFLCDVKKEQWEKASTVELLEIYGRAKRALMPKCSHCGEPTMLVNDVIATHDFPVPCRQVCPGSGKAPWKDGDVLGKERGE